MTQIDADKDKPTIELRGEEAKKALTQPQQNPLVAISQVLNNHAGTINEMKNLISNFELDVKAAKMTQEIFDKRFGLVERQLDNIEKELSRIQNILKEK